MTRHCQSVMIIAGEASGDLHGAHVVRALRSMVPEVTVMGIGGGAMRDAGVEILVPAEALSVVGITEVASKLPALFEARRRVRDALAIRRPRLLILIDFPDFNLHVAGMAKALGIPVLYYISPQLWAWRKGRVKTIGRRVDHMAVILPFEEPFYRRHGIPVTFVGHPLLDRPPAADVDSGISGFTGTPDAPVVGLLPGSRVGEVLRILPEMMVAARRIHHRFPRARFIVSRAPTVSAGVLSTAFAQAHPSLPVTVSTADVRHIFQRSTLVIAASGTVALEAAMARTPMVVVYRVSPVSYWLGRALVRVPFISLVNLIAGRAVVPELIQDDALGDRIAETVVALMGDPAAMADMTRQLAGIQQKMGTPGASLRVARIAMEMMTHGGGDPRRRAAPAGD
ncbi:MAG: lipid-A-disaccharide synthase [Pseudomonadota bacterium]